MAVQAIPNIDALVEPLLGTPYATWNCWQLVLHLLHEGFGFDLATDPGLAAKEVQEVWFRGDEGDPLTLAQPWDLAIMTGECLFPISGHVGLVMPEQRFVHARTAETGVAIERLRKWRPRLLQLARLRRLL